MLHFIGKIHHPTPQINSPSDSTDQFTIRLHRSTKDHGFLLFVTVGLVIWSPLWLLVNLKVTVEVSSIPFFKTYGYLHCQCPNVLKCPSSYRQNRCWCRSLTRPKCLGTNGTSWAEQDSASCTVAAFKYKQLRVHVNMLQYIEVCMFFCIWSCLWFDTTSLAGQSWQL